MEMWIYILILLLAALLVILSVVLIFILKSKKQEQNSYVLELENARSKLNQLETDNALSKQHLLNAEEKFQRYADLEFQFQTEQKAWQEQQSKLNASLATARAMYEELLKQSNDARVRLKESLNEQEQLRMHLQEKEIALSRMQSEHRHIQENLLEQKKNFEIIQNENLNRFEMLAQKALEKNSQSFSEKQQKELNTLLSPLKENLQAFQKQVQEVYEKEDKQRFSLQEQVKQLMELNQLLSSEAQKLSNALTSQSKVQGDWGELILEQILEHSGLKEGVHYFVQEAIKDEVGKVIKNEENQTMIPDVIVHYPGQRQIIIDAKCSITAYIEWTQTDDKEREKQLVKQHLQSVKKHIQDLYKKNYQKYLKTLDFVMMFIPNEGAYAAALNMDPNLWLEAYQKRVLLVSPSNLIASLKLIDHLWVKEQQDQNTQAIIERGSLLYEKVIGFLEDYEKVGEELEKTTEMYKNAKNKLHLGKGNIVRQTEMLKELGASSNKNIPSSFQ